MVIVENQSDFNEFLSKLRIDNCVIDVVLSDTRKHALNNKPSLIITIFPKQGDLWIVPISHNEGVTIPEALVKVKESLKMSLGKKCVFDKKMMVETFGGDVGFVDLNIIKYLDTGSYEALDEVTNNAQNFVTINFKRLSELNRAVPIYKHCEIFLQKYSRFVIPPNDGSLDSSFEFINNVALARFSELEAIGMAVDEEKFLLQFGEEQQSNIKNGLVFTQYNLFTSTGRPSNRFGGINFAALNKKDGSRTPFVSRYGDDGMLIMVDYSAFHPRLISNLINYDLALDTNPYEYLARYFFKTNTPNKEEIALSKGYTFQQLYGTIQKQYAHIPYYKKVQEYIDHRWRYFEENGFVETPVYFRKIKRCHIDDPSPNKLFNYILQAYETEVGVLALGRILDHLKSRLTQPVLYTYDSLLFDAHRSDGQETIRQIRDIMIDNQFPVKIFAGKDYNDMRKIEID
jgi:hypothetical protein